MKKRCTNIKCNEIKDSSEFYRDSRRNDGLCSQCKVCCRESKKSYRNKNKEKISNSAGLYYLENKEKINIVKKKYRHNNKEKINKYFTEKRQKDILFKISCNLRTRLYDAVKNNYKSGSAVKDLGCSVKDLKIHLEQQFQEGMDWKNWSKVGWHIDHIKPLASFDLTNKEELLKACNYTNLQPLWAKDNLSKSNKIYEQS